jgi:hypothetical protein
MTSFDYDINHYTIDDLTKLFNVKENENITPEELDMRISNINYSAGLEQNNSENMQAISRFLIIAKEKYLQLTQYYKLQYDNTNYGHSEMDTEKFVNNTFLDNNEHFVIEKTKKMRIPMQVQLFNVNSSDRDRTAWPHASFFEINLPQSIKDISFMGLYDYNFYFQRPNFTNFYQNTKMTFQITQTFEAPSIFPPTTTTVIDLTNKKITIELPSGFYTDYTLLQEIVTLMNSAVTIEAATLAPGVMYQNFGYYLDTVSLKLNLYNKEETFKLIFDAPESYQLNNWQIKDIYNLNTAWGLGYFLGFNKQQYTSTSENISTQGTVNNIQGDNVFNSSLDNMLYLELDGFDHAFQTSTPSGKVNSYFARIPIMEGYTNDSFGLENRIVSAERLSKLKIRLRFHNGILFDTMGQNYDLTFNFKCKK